ncbi:MFS transporter [Tomitella cavernea]|uniref:MFS transporter n=1 Tax=Tomitella cavernea TaxID=1387982 RepID=A0ABP9CFQ8_9ACTN|nr:MFS transporter [Tomitella cavernea]
MIRGGKELTPGSAEPGRSPSLITLVLCLTGTSVALLQTMVVPILPDFPTIFGVRADDASWLITITLLTAAVGTPLISRLADMVGKKRMLQVSLAFMVTGSALPAVSSSFAAAVVGRGLQGFAIALIPVGISLLRDHLPARKVAGATALMSATLGIGSALALPLAGVIDTAVGWQGIFWVPAAFGTVMLVAVRVVVPESPVRTGGRFDWFGAILLSGALTALLMAITKGGAWGWSSAETLATFAAAAALLGVWIPFERRVANPLVDLRTSTRRPVLLTNAASALVGFSMYANMLLTTQQLQLPDSLAHGFGLSVMAAGFAMIPGGMAMALFSPFSAYITNRRGPRTTLFVGAAVMAAAYLARTQLDHSVAFIVLGAMFVSIGTAITYSSMPMLIMESVPRTETASANGLNSLLRSIGTSTASAVVAALLTAMTVGVADLASGTAAAGGGVPSALAHLPAPAAFDAAYYAAAGAAALACAVALTIPKPARGTRARAGRTPRHDRISPEA